MTTMNKLLEFIRHIAGNSNLIAIGEAGFDKLRGPSMELQRSAFEEQAVIAGRKQETSCNSLCKGMG